MKSSTENKRKQTKQKDSIHWIYNRLGTVIYPVYTLSQFSNTVRKALLLAPLCRWGNSGSGRRRKLWPDTKQIRSRMGFGNLNLCDSRALRVQPQRKFTRKWGIWIQINFVPFGQENWILWNDRSMNIRAYLGIPPTCKNTFSTNLVQLKFSHTLHPNGGNARWTKAYLVWN